MASVDPGQADHALDGCLEVLSDAWSQPTRGDILQGPCPVPILIRWLTEQAPS